MANGFANRFLWFCVKRSKSIPSGKGVPPEKLTPLIEELKEAISFAKAVGEMSRDAQAEELWGEIYSGLSDGKPGLVGAITSRAEAQVLRLSMIYALMDRSDVIQVEHLRAALALWTGCEKSVDTIFADYTGDRNVDLVAKPLRVFRKMTRTQIHQLLGRNASKNEVDRVINVLCNTGKATLVIDQGVQVLWARN
jgi:hypothetical protein